MSQPKEPKQAMPVDPITALAEGAMALHELFMGYVNAGFTEPQAMQIICAVMVEGVRQNRGGVS